MKLIKNVSSQFIHDMIQIIITYLIVIGAIALSVIKIIKFFQNKQSSPCNGCNGCEIKQEILKNSKGNISFATKECCAGEKENISHHKIKFDTQKINWLSKNHLLKK